MTFADLFSSALEAVLPSVYAEEQQQQDVAQVDDGADEQKDGGDDSAAGDDGEEEEEEEEEPEDVSLDCNRHPYLAKPRPAYELRVGPGWPGTLEACT